MIVPIGIGFALVILALIFTMLMRRQLREKYALLWLLIGFAMLVLALFPDLLGAFAGLLGVIVPSNLLFALAVALLIGDSASVVGALSSRRGDSPCCRGSGDPAHRGRGAPRTRGRAQAWRGPPASGLMFSDPWNS